jgi:predicted enzyme related to lactoylglutathione lyase
MSRVVHFDFPTDDPEKSMVFFTYVFGWKFKKWLNEDYWLIDTGDKLKHGINGSMIKRFNQDHTSSILVKVENINLTLKQVEEEGGTVVYPKRTIPKVGYFAYFKDPECNLIGVIQFDTKAKKD